MMKDNNRKMIEIKHNPKDFWINNYLSPNDALLRMYGKLYINDVKNDNSKQ